MKAEREIEDAVQAAQRAGMDPKEFMQACWEAWESEQHDRLRRDNDTFRLAIRGQK